MREAAPGQLGAVPIRVATEKEAETTSQSVAHAALVAKGQGGQIASEYVPVELEMALPKASQISPSAIDRKSSIMAITADLKKTDGKWFITFENKTRRGFAHWTEGPYRWKMTALLKIWAMIRLYG